jgi:glycosyltransferase involved in cell wall biosynthesis
VDILHVQDPWVALLMQRARDLGLVRARTILAHGTEEPASDLRRIRYLQHLAPWHLEEARRAGAWRDGWTAIPNFVDTERFRPGRADALRRELGLPRDAFVVLSTAAIKRRHKRIDHLVREVADLRRVAPELPVWLVVAGGWEPETDDVVREGTEALKDRVRFLVRFGRERMPELYRAADVFVLASLKEMMPLAVLEAAASGLPCVVHRHPVLQWMVGPGGDPTDMAAPGGLAARLAELALDHAGRRAIGERARRHCEATFARGPVVDEVLRYYEAVSEAGAR